MQMNRPVIALYDMPGLVYLIGGFSPVTPWYFDPADVPRQSIRSLAQIGKPEFHKGGDFKPLLLVNQELDAETLQILNGTGIDYPANYTKLASLHDPASGKDIQLWVPK